MATSAIRLLAEHFGEQDTALVVKSEIAPLAQREFPSPTPCVAKAGTACAGWPVCFRRCVSSGDCAPNWWFVCGRAAILCRACFLPHLAPRAMWRPRMSLSARAVQGAESSSLCSAVRSAPSCCHIPRSAGISLRSWLRTRPSWHGCLDVKSTLPKFFHASYLLDGAAPGDGSSVRSVRGP